MPRESMERLVSNTPASARTSLALLGRLSSVRLRCRSESDTVLGRFHLTPVKHASSFQSPDRNLDECTDARSESAT